VTLTVAGLARTRLDWKVQTRARDDGIRRDDRQLTASAYDDLPGRGITQVGGAIRRRSS
jgi:hypothetical protein